MWLMNDCFVIIIIIIIIINIVTHQVKSAINLSHNTMQGAYRCLSDNS